MGKSNTLLSKKEMALIRESVNEGIAAGMAQAFAIAKDAYKATEKRLYAIPILEKKIQNDKEKLEELKGSGPQDRTTSIVRFQKGGLRVSPEDMLDAVIRNFEATIAADEYEIAVMYAALASIEKDAYYQTVTGKYFDGEPDEVIAERIPCDTTTVWRNRKRLMQRLAVTLYGAAAI
jgi:hypothetical protein